MKNFLTTTLIILLSTFSLSGQCDINNPSFEDWTLTPFELDANTGTLFQNDMMLPDSSTSVIRLLFILFGSFGDPTYGQILEADPQGFIGMDQSTDATDGDFAVKLQGGYDIPFADIYSPSACAEIPDSFSFDVKHEGAFEDTLTVFVVYDEGLAALPQDTAELQNYPAYAFGEFHFDSDSPYQTITMPVVKNFAASVDTFYYLFIANTNDSSYFLIDNLQTVEADDPVLCSFDNYPPFSLTQTEVVCLCDEEIASNDGIEGTFFTDFIDQDTVPPVFMVVNANEEIIYTSGEDINALFETDFCPLEELFLVQMLYENEDDIQGIEIGNSLSDITGCHALSEKLAINTIYEEFDFVMNRNGEALNDQDTVFICSADSIFDIFSFSSPTNLIHTLFIVDDETELVVDQFHDESNMSNIPPGIYLIGMSATTDTLPNYIGQELEYANLGPCLYGSDNSYDIRILDIGEPGCLTSTEDPEIMANLQIVQNPVSENLTILANLNKEIELSIIDMNGKTLLKDKQNSIHGYLSYDVSSYPSGLYFIHAKSPDGAANFKFVKQ